MGSQRLAHLIAMQVMHHGSNSNWHKGLAGKINPETAVFPADPHYQYRHPHGAVWDDFASCSIPILVDTRMPCHLTQRSEERRVGKECVSTGRSRWSQYH